MPPPSTPDFPANSTAGHAPGFAILAEVRLSYDFLAPLLQQALADKPFIGDDVGKRLRVDECPFTERTRSAS